MRDKRYFASFQRMLWGMTFALLVIGLLFYEIWLGVELSVGANDTQSQQEGVTEKTIVATSHAEIKNTATIPRGGDPKVIWKRNQRVEWVRDEAWFQRQSQRGCCPYAKEMYEGRYAKVQYRCCTSRLHELEPLKAVGGFDFSHITTNSTVLIQGDSLAEQHFLGMLCYAWATLESVDLKLVSNAGDPMLLKQGTMWQARIGDRLTVSFLRWNQPHLNLVPVDITTPDYFIVGGWHHGGANFPTISIFLDQVQTQRSKPTIVVEALPNHFPGGKYSKGQEYPPAQIWKNRTHFYSNEESSQAVCDTTNHRGDPDINTDLITLVQNRTNVSLLRVNRLYQHRGDAHVGIIPKGTIGPQGRDCLHFCLAPGVLDALAKETLAAIVKG
jgi:hypothetical protein